MQTLPIEIISNSNSTDVPLESLHKRTLKRVPTIKELDEFDAQRIERERLHREQRLARLSQKNNINRAKLRRKVPWLDRITLKQHDEALERGLEAGGWRGKLSNFLEDPPWDTFLLTCTVIDVIMQVALMLMELISGSNCPALGLAQEYQIADEIWLAIEVMNWIGTAFLIFFLADIVLRFIAFGPWFYLGSLPYFVDLMIIIAVIIVDFVIPYDSGLHNLQIILALRLVRIVDLMYAILLVSVERAELYRQEVEENYEDALEEIQLLREHLDSLRGIAGNSVAMAQSGMTEDRTKLE